MCKTLPINYKIPACPPTPTLPPFLLHLHAPPQSNYKIVEAMSYSNSNCDCNSLFDCIRRHSWAQKLASYEVVSLSLSKSKSETDLQLPLLVVVSVPLGLRLHCRIRCNWKGAARQAGAEGGTSSQPLRSVAHLNPNLKHLHSSSVSTQLDFAVAALAYF